VREGEKLLFCKAFKKKVWGNPRKGGAKTATVEQEVKSTRGGEDVGKRKGKMKKNNAGLYVSPRKKGANGLGRFRARVGSKGGGGSAKRTKPNWDLVS